MKPKTKDSLKDRAAGSIVGALIGDALGLGPHWYYDLAQLREQFGTWIDGYTDPKPGRYHEGLKAGNLSQSGLLTLELLRSIVDNNGYDEADFTRRLDDRFLQQMDGSPYAGPGGFTNQSIRELHQARVRDGKPCSILCMLPTAYYLAARFQDDFEQAVLHAVNGRGQNMSRAMLTGALAGAQVGLSGIPQRFIDGLTEGREIVDLARRIDRSGLAMNISDERPASIAVSLFASRRDCFLFSVFSAFLTHSPSHFFSALQSARIWPPQAV